MTTARIAGQDFDLTLATVESVAVGLEPEPVRDHYVVVAGRRYPPKQVLAAVTGLDRADFTTHQARAVLRRLGLGVYRRTPPPPAPAGAAGPHGGAEARLLDRYKGRWVAQVPGEILFDADSPQAVLRWLRRHNLRARVWRVPATPADVGSALSAP
ncbi:MAG TPA: hypothetical protein VFH58_15880 [Acidimicrobiales bacterium]|nr:hypothetical protein [Acidimicrobiales bacterium]